MSALHTLPEQLERDAAAERPVRAQLVALDAEADRIGVQIDRLDIPAWRKAAGAQKVDDVRRQSGAANKRMYVEILRGWFADVERELEDERWYRLPVSARAQFAKQEATAFELMGAAERVAAELPEAARARRHAFIEQHLQSQLAEVRAPRVTAGPAPSMAHAPASCDPVPEEAHEIIVRELERAGLPTDDATVRAIWEEQQC